MSMKCVHYGRPRKSAPADTVSLRQGCCSLFNLKQDAGVLVPMKSVMKHNHKPDPRIYDHYRKNLRLPVALTDKVEALISVAAPPNKLCGALRGIV